MNSYWTYTIKNSSPILALSLHSGHQIPQWLENSMAITSDEMLREEDPFTDIFASVFDSHILCTLSRFALDLNRPIEKAVYLTPDMAWGLNVFNETPEQEKLKKLREIHTVFYDFVTELIQRMIEMHGVLVVLDIHSYNHRRKGPDAPVDNPADSPDINIGTATRKTNRWDDLIQSFMMSLGKSEIEGRLLDVRENVKFKGGYFAEYIHERFTDSVCVLSLEYKKTFMDEWSGRVNNPVLQELVKTLHSKTPLIEDLLLSIKNR
jgi:N-formylglutamate deformylase